jgi:hypothetical protein
MQHVICNTCHVTGASLRQEHLGDGTVLLHADAVLHAQTDRPSSGRLEVRFAERPEWRAVAVVSVGASGRSIATATVRLWGSNSWDG